MQRFIAHHKLDKFKFNTHFPVNTVQIMRGAVAAEMDGNLPKYMDVVFRAMWEDSLKMDDADVIRAALDAGGLDGARILARIQDQDVKDKLIANTSMTVERGTFGCPTFYVGKEIFFGKDRLRDLEEEIVTAKAR
jgi:2-hydroxychromene-2-carboxylate isomerase